MTQPTNKVNVPDAKFEALKGRLNSAIHELVFACQHLEQNDLDDAANCLMTAHGTIESVNLEIVVLELEGGAK
jgi:hypothetical protein